MRVFKTTLVFLLFSASAAMAAPASDESVRQLMALTQMQKLLEGVGNQIVGSMNTSIQQMVKDKAPTAKQQEAITKLKARMVDYVRSQLAWEKLEPTYVSLYKETFSEEEVAGMLSFYRTAAGQAVLTKMPVLMQKTMAVVQKVNAEGAPQLQKIQEDFVADLKAASN